MNHEINMQTLYNNIYSLVLVLVLLVPRIESVYTIRSVILNISISIYIYIYKLYSLVLAGDMGGITYESLSNATFMGAANSLNEKKTSSKISSQTTPTNWGESAFVVKKYCCIKGLPSLLYKTFSASGSNSCEVSPLVVMSKPNAVIELLNVALSSGTFSASAVALKKKNLFSVTPPEVVRVSAPVPSVMALFRLKEAELEESSRPGPSPGEKANPGVLMLGNIKKGKLSNV